VVETLWADRTPISNIQACFGVDRYALVLVYYHALSDLQRVLLFQFSGVGKIDRIFRAQALAEAVHCWKPHMTRTVHDDASGGEKERVIQVYKYIGRRLRDARKGVPQLRKITSIIKGHTKTIFGCKPLGNFPLKLGIGTVWVPQDRSALRFWSNLLYNLKTFSGNLGGSSNKSSEVPVRSRQAAYEPELDKVSNSGCNNRNDRGGALRGLCAD
jgi:hypothetical protein